MIIPDIDKLNTGQILEKSIRIRYPEFYKYLKERYKDIHYSKFSELLYLYKHNLSEPPTCKICGNSVRFESITKGYHPYCCLKCQSSDPETKKKILNTKIERYGIDNITNHKKTIQTNLERYGVENPMQVKSFADTLHKNKKEKYGNENWNNRKKAKETNLERYGVEHVMQVKEIVEKSLEKRKEIYGEDNPTNHKKAIQTNLERYGVECVFASPEIQEKIRKTNNERLGVDYPMQSEQVKKKSKQIVMDRYGVENIMHLQENIDKIKQTKLEKFGVENNSMTQEWKNIIRNKHDEIIKKQHNTKKQNGTFNTSSIEEEFTEWLKEHNINFKRQYRDKRYPFACDFYFPDKDLFLEIQGMWTHGEHPYNPDDRDDISTVNEWKEKDTKFYDNAINVWTVSDPLKRETAKKNGLNWKEVFTTDLNELVKEVEDIIS